MMKLLLGFFVFIFGFSFSSFNEQSTINVLSENYGANFNNSIAVNDINSSNNLNVIEVVSELNPEFYYDINYEVMLKAVQGAYIVFSRSLLDWTASDIYTQIQNNCKWFYNGDFYNYYFSINTDYYFSRSFDISDFNKDTHYYVYIVRNHTITNPNYFVPNAENVNLYFEFTLCNVELPQEPTLEHHIFEGWYYDDLFQHKYYGGILIQDTQLYAKFVRIPHNVTLKYNGGNDGVLSKTVIVYQGINNDFGTPVRRGYIFKGWHYAGGALYENQLITEDIELTAIWEIIKLTVTFYVNGEVYKTMEVDWGTCLNTVIQTSDLLSYNVKSFDNGIDILDTNYLINANTTIDIEPKTTGQGVMSNWKKILAISCVVISAIGVLVAIMSVSKKKHKKVR